MKIIILAAGKGARLMPLTKNTPKPLIDLGNGKTLLEEQLEQIQKSQVIDEVILVTGYLSFQIEAKIQTFDQKGISISTLYNPFYDVSNNFVSLWLTRHKMTEDFMITNGDNIFNYDVFQDLAKQTDQEGIYLTTVGNDELYDDDMKVTLKRGAVERVSKLIKNERADCESVGLTLISGKKQIKNFVNTLDELIQNEEYLKHFWLEIFNVLSERGVVIHAFDMKDRKKWKEVDFHLDLTKARKILGISQ